MVERERERLEARGLHRYILGVRGLESKGDRKGGIEG